MEVSLYRYFCEDDVLLYVGISKNPVMRSVQHETDKEWFHDVRLIEVEWFKTRKKALKAEAIAIVRERPKWNISGVRKRRVLRRTLRQRKAPKPTPARGVRLYDSKIGPSLPPMFGPPRPWRKIALAPIGVLVDGVKPEHHLPPEHRATVLKGCRVGDIIYAPKYVDLPDAFWASIAEVGAYKVVLE